MKWIIPMGLIAIVVLISGCTIPTEPKIDINEFQSRCERSGGNFYMPFCGTPQDPNCPIRESVCDCGYQVIAYKSVMNSGWSECWII